MQKTFQAGQKVYHERWGIGTVIDTLVSTDDRTRQLACVIRVDDPDRVGEKMTKFVPNSALQAVT